MITNIDNYGEHMSLLDNPVRQVRARIERNVWNESNNWHDVFVYQDKDRLKEITIERVGDDSKFFGFGIVHKANFKLRDPERTLTDITTSDFFQVYFNTFSSTEPTQFPNFEVSEVRRDEKTNELSITCYDRLYKASAHYTSELGIGNTDIQTFAIGTQYAICDLAEAIADFLELEVIIPSDVDAFNIFYDGGANLEGSELLRDVLDDIAEATQTIYYLNYQNKLVFKKLDKDGAPVFGLDKNRYIELDSKTNRRITGVCHVTELGDNILAQDDQSGTIQYVRDNCFWDLRDDIDTLVQNALAAVNGMTINQFECKWRGNYLVEVGDKLALYTKDNETVYAYLVNDTLEYNGALSQTTKWNFSGDSADNTNPATLGESLKQTFAKVDKINKEIDIVVSHTQQTANSIAQIQLDAESIKQSVKETNKKVDDMVDSTNQQIAELTTQVSQTITSEDLKIEVEKQIQEVGSIDKIVTSTGFTFNEDGLTISKTGTEMNTLISEDGMIVRRNDETMLEANNQGVTAFNLHASTYLIIGKYSRFEDFGERTGCFWIGP